MFKFVVQLSHSLILVTESSNMAPHGKEHGRNVRGVLTFVIHCILHSDSQKKCRSIRK